MSSVHPRARRRAVRMSAVLGAVLLTVGCAGTAGRTGADPSASRPEVAVPGGDALVLQVAHVGGYVSESVLAGRLPLVSLYGDGRVVAEGPVDAVHPGPALPNVLAGHLDEGEVERLVDRALDAGVGDGFDHGRPPVADVPSTRFTVVTAAGTEVSEVYALEAGIFTGGDPPGLTPEQVAAREGLQALLDELTALRGVATESYVPEAVAAVASEWVEPDDRLPPQPPVAWPGPALPGEPLGRRSGASCVVADGPGATAVLAAARTANATTPWTAADGRRWSVVLRPLLPHEDGCADLPVG